MTEALGFITGAACVYLTLRESIWNFPVGLANNLFFLVLFLQGRLFGDAGLQVLYILLGVQGWYWWLHGGENKSELRVARATPGVMVGAVGFVVLATPCLMLGLRAMKDAAPWLDALTTVLSLAAQYLLNRKMIENWLVWLLADLIYVYLYALRGLQLTAVLYFGFACFCVAGYWVWRRNFVGTEAGEHA